MNTPRISVVGFCDPTHVDQSAQYVDRFLKQTLPHDQFEMLIVEDVQAARFRETLTACAVHHPDLAFRYVEVKLPGRAAAINAGIAQARAPIVAIFADDAIPTADALAAHLHYHESNRDPMAVSIGPMLFRNELRHDPFRRWLEDSGSLFGLSMQQQFTRWPASFFYCGNCAIKRELIDQIGGFDERFVWFTWNDYEFGLRLSAAGGYSQYVSAALAWHEHRVTLGERARVMRTGGHAARLHESFGISNRPWQAMLDSARAQRHMLLPADDEHLPLVERIPTFQAYLNRAFLEGYEAESRGDRTDIVLLQS